MNDLRSVLDGTQNLISETFFNEALTERERSELNLEIETLRGSLKMVKNKMIYYDGEIGKDGSR